VQVANVDGSYIPQNGTATTRVVIKDHTGKLTAAGCNILQSCSCAEEAEAMALADGAAVEGNGPRAPLYLNLIVPMCEKCKPGNAKLIPLKEYLC
jgi:hypothetical protein